MSTDPRDPMQTFLRTVWKEDVAPLLRGRYADQRAKAARMGGLVAGVAGTLVDRLFGLRGRPTTRAMTVLGATFGAMLPDAWDWEYLRRLDNPAATDAVAERVRARAAALSDSAALSLFGLSSGNTRDELQAAWRNVVLRWHPDKAPDERSRTEHHMTFLAYQTAYEQLCAAYDAGRLPR